MTIVLLLFICGYLLYLGGRISAIERAIDALRSSSAPSRVERVAKDLPRSVEMKDTHSATQHTAPEKVDVQPRTLTDISEDATKGQVTARVAQTSRAEEASAEAITAFFAWLKEDWLVKSGALLFLIGAGWFVSYAFAEGWIGPMGRIMVGYLVGVAFLIGGVMRVRVYGHQGSLFLVLGSTVVLLTTWAARTLYDFFTPGVALTLMFLSVAFVAYVAVVRGSARLAFVSIVLAAAAPLLTNTPEPSLVGLMSYLLVVTVGTVWIVVKMGWRQHLVAMLFILLFYSMPYLPHTPREESGIALLFSFLFAGIFTVVSVSTILADRRARTADQIIVAGTALYLLIWMEATVPAHWESVLYAAWSIVFAASGYMLFRVLHDAVPFFLYASAGLLYFVLATIATFDGPLLTVSLILEASLLPILVHKISGRTQLLVPLSFVMIIPAMLSLPSVTAGAWRHTVPFGDLAVLLVAASSFVLLGAYMLRLARTAHDASVYTCAQWLLGIGGFYVLVLIWLIPQGLCAPQYDFGRFITFTIYTVLGIGMYINGLTHDRKSVRIAGGVLVGLVIARLLLVEVWDMEMSLRIVTFLVIGVLLLATALLEKKQSAHMQ